MPVSPEASSRSSTSSWVSSSGARMLVGLEQEAVRRVRDAADDVVAVQHDGGEVAVAEARHLDRVLGEQLRDPAQSHTGPVQTRTASTGTCRNE